MSRVLDEGCPRYQRLGQRGTKTKTHSGNGCACGVERRGGLIKSHHVTEQQLFEVLARPYFDSLIDPDARGWLNEMIAAAELVTITERIAACRDPTDDKFLELAVNGHADVSGDGDLLALNPFR